MGRCELESDCGGFWTEQKNTCMSNEVCCHKEFEEERVKQDKENASQVCGHHKIEPCHIHRDSKSCYTSRESALGCYWEAEKDKDGNETRYGNCRTGYPRDHDYTGEEDLKDCDENNA